MGKWDELQSTVSHLLNRVAYGKRISDPSVAGAGDVVRSNGGNKPDEYFPDPHRRERIGRVLTNLGKFAVDSAVDESLKSVTGGIKVCKIVKEGSNEHQYSRGIKKQDLMVAMEEMQTKMEKMQEDVNQLKLQNETFADYAVDLEPFEKFPDEPKESSSASPKSNPKKVFIRSRL